MMKRNILLIICSVLFLVGIQTFAQTGVKYKGPEDGAGDPQKEAEAYMIGNRVQVLFKNNTELGDYKYEAARWPRGNRSVRMHDGIGLLIGAVVYLKDGNIPVTDKNEIKSLKSKGLLDSLFFVQTNYREHMDLSPNGDVEWGFHPAPGYNNPFGESPAMSDNPNTWPQEGWPSVGSEKHWAGEWKGRFGRGQIRASLETYFVANDAQDQEYLQESSKVKYLPRPGVNIGDFSSSVSTQNGQPWGGLGIRVQQRGFQWNNPMAQDAIFWEYTIANISDYDLPYVSFGYWMDNNIGGENTGDDGYFDKVENLAYSWDVDDKSDEGYRPGTFGFAFLESPGLDSDGIDNDDDGIIDEKRANEAFSKVSASYGISDVEKFKSFYGIDSLQEHWDADEDQDWTDGTEINLDPGYQVADGDFPGDDVGLDGVAPGEENYTGPDADGTEGNHRPDLSADGRAEPNFGWTDVSETDMLGLTTLLFFEAPPGSAPFKDWFIDDEGVWNKMCADSLQSGATGISNLFEIFASGRFTLEKGKTAFISLSELHSYDETAGLNSADHSAPSLFELKKTVQLIYEKDYRFAQAPLMPKLTAVPGDGKVELFWDNRSDQLTKEPFLPAGVVEGNNDFEGYKVYRSTDKDFNDPLLITNGRGSKVLRKPIFQCDKKNGRKGFADYGMLDGVAYYLGEDTGLTHSFVDSTVENGRTYYYAVVAYDFGIPSDLMKGSDLVSKDKNGGIAPAENNVVVRTDEFENINFAGANVAIVTPGMRAQDKIDESTHQVKFNNSLGNAEIIPEVVAPDLIKDGHEYKIKFNSKYARKFTVQFVGDKYQLINNGFKVYDMTDNDKLVYEDVIGDIGTDSDGPINYKTILEKSTESGEAFYHLPYKESKSTDVFDGVRLNVKFESLGSKLNHEKTNWVGTNYPVDIKVTELCEKYDPADYNIIFADSDIYEARVKRYHPGMRNTDLSLIPRSEILFLEKFPFRIEKKSSIVSADGSTNIDTLDFVVHDINGNGEYDILEDKVLAATPKIKKGKAYWTYTLFTLDFSQITDKSELPGSEDFYQVRFHQAFAPKDSVTFTVTSTEKQLDEVEVKQSMEDIRVVPNPYIATNTMEPSFQNKFRNQARRLMFTSLPESCTIKIFTVSGILVRELHSDDGLTSYSGYGDTGTGILHWDMLSNEGLEIAAGMYIYHVKCNRTGQEKVGKFGVIK